MKDSGRCEFRAYGPDGKLILHIWTSAPGPYAAEKAASQAGCDKGRYLYVDITDSEGSGERLFPLTPHSPY